MNTTDQLKLAPKIGIDIGGVIIEHSNEHPSKRGEDTSFFSDGYLNTKQVLNAFESIKEIVTIFHPDNVFLVTFTSKNTKTFEKSLLWLESKDFFQTTGVKKENIYNVFNRKFKNDVCKKNSINYFIDDRKDVLDSLANPPVIKSFWLYEKSSLDMSRPHIVPCKTWEEIMNHIKNIKL